MTKYAQDEDRANYDAIVFEEPEPQEENQRVENYYPEFKGMGAIPVISVAKVAGILGVDPQDLADEMAAPWGCNDGCGMGVFEFQGENHVEYDDLWDFLVFAYPIPEAFKAIYHYDLPKYDESN